MSVHLQREIANLKKRVLELCAAAEDSVRQAARALAEKDVALAERVRAGDTAIDQAEVSIEEECLKILALHQPVANDLRFLVATLKFNHDLERIADLAVSIAGRAIKLADRPANGDVDFGELAARTQELLRRSIDALVSLDADLARRVIEEDEVVDTINRRICGEVRERMRTQPAEIDALLQLFFISRHFERIADHAVNIAEDVLYLVEGRIVRHRAGETA